MANATRNRKIIWTLVVVLAVLHHDFWLWSDRSIVFGFMPVGLFYQAWISVGAAVAWWLMVMFAWPVHLEEWADEVQESGSPERDRG